MATRSNNAALPQKAVAKKAPSKKVSATKKTTTKKPTVEPEVCFVIMPFGGWLDDYYTSIYSPAIKDARLMPHRADDLFRPSTIVNDIWAYTKRAKVLLADLTGKNPNVFYELGLAHALAKPVILIAESMEDIPFDLRALRIILYDKNAPDWGAILRAKIHNSLTQVLESPIEAVLPAFLDIKAAGAKPLVSAEQKDLIEIKQEMDLLRRQLGSRDLTLTSKWSTGSPMSPNDAREYMRTAIKEDISFYSMRNYLANRGVPLNWIDRELSRAREGMSVERSDVADDSINDNLFMVGQRKSQEERLSSAKIALKNSQLKPARVPVPSKAKKNSVKTAAKS